MPRSPGAGAVQRVQGWPTGHSYGLWALGFGLWALGFGLWALGFGLWALGFGLWAVLPGPKWALRARGLPLRGSQAQAHLTHRQPRGWRLGPTPPRAVVHLRWHSAVLCPWVPCKCSGEGRQAARAGQAKAESTTHPCPPPHEQGKGGCGFFTESGPAQVECGQPSRPMVIYMGGKGGSSSEGLMWCWHTRVQNTDFPLASASSDMIGWSRVLLSHTLDAARSY